MNSKIIANFIKKEFEDTGKPFLFNGKSYRINSIFEEDDGLHLYLFISNGKFMDFKAGEQGDFEWLVTKFKKLEDKNDAPGFIHRNYFKVTTSALIKRIEELRKEGFDDPKSEIIPKRIKKPEDFLPMNRVTKTNKRFFDYLEGRGIDRDQIRKFKFHYAISGNYMNRVILPIFYEKKFVYFIARDITNKSSKKYLNPKAEEVKKNGTGSIVFNLDFVKEGDTVIICEGPFNCFHRLPKNTVLVAVQGKSLLLNQFRKLHRKKPGKYIIAYDSDEYFNKSSNKTHIFLSKNAEKTPIELINWEKYRKIKEDVCDFGDLYGLVDVLPVYSQTYFDYIKQHFLGV